MPKQIIAIGIHVPGEIEIEDVAYDDRRSLLDADIVLFSPKIDIFTNSQESYLGKKCLDEYNSFKLKDASAHWRKQILASAQAGKSVFVFIGYHEPVYVDTGRKEYSGTGRNRRTTRIVDQHNPYSDIPAELGTVVHSPGTRMKMAPKAEIIASCWHEFGKHTRYEVYFEDIKVKPLLLTQHGEKVVGGLVSSKSGGFLLVLPPPDLDELAATLAHAEDNAIADTAPAAEDIAANQEESNASDEWSAAETAAGSKFISAIVEIDRALRAAQARTPVPEWTKDTRYEMSEELRIRAEVDRLDQQLKELEALRNRLQDDLAASGNLRGLLFETGHHLEDAIVDALRILGFSAQRFREGDSEFDVVFVSPEGGRFLGEAEGKDNRAVNIDKMDQLERNIREEFSVQEGTEYAKGVLFGNANRLAPLAERTEYFTAKCIAAAVRSGVALVRTPDLFEVARYVKEHADKNLARQCREAILVASGAVVRFPTLPVNSALPNEALDC